MRVPVMTILMILFITLPFKVMGACHTSQNQTHLMKAEAKMYEENGRVSARLVPEPQKEKDSNVILSKSIMVMDSTTLAIFQRSSHHLFIPS